MKPGETKKLVVRVSKAGTFSPGSFSSLVLAQLRLGFPVPPLEHLMFFIAGQEELNRRV